MAKGKQTRKRERESLLKRRDRVVHCWSRCANKKFLMGKHEGKDYGHRRQWLINRLELLSRAFSIQILFYAILSNHFHLVLRVCRRAVTRMGDYEVAQRWLTAYPGKRTLEGTPPEPTEEQILKLAANKTKIKELRERLADVSWFKAALKEDIARRANHEAETSGSFWGRRFGRREVVDDEGLLAVGLYTDLNLFRAGEGKLPWKSEFCSAGIRRREQAGESNLAPWLAEFTLTSDSSSATAGTNDSRADDSRADEPCAENSQAGSFRGEKRGCLAMPYSEYERLLAWAATKPVDGKATMPREVAELLERRRFEPDHFRMLMDNLPDIFRSLVGRAEALRDWAKQVGCHWFQGSALACQYFS